MNFEKVSFASAPERIAAEKYDCIWIAFGPRPGPAPLQSKALQWLDWKLQGQISRFLLESGAGTGEVTFLPTMKKLSAPYLALHSDSKLNWEAFVKNCEGLKLRSVLYFFEDSTKLREVEQHFKQQKIQAYPESVALGSDL